MTLARCQMTKHGGFDFMNFERMYADLNRFSD
jgi:hypothetical protein